MYISLGMSTQNKSNKRTAWKKNREFGDIMGGRCRRKLDGNVFVRYHSFHRPTEFDELPIIVVDNPSRDYYFPVTPDEIKAALSSPPETSIVTHVWLRKHSKKNDFFVEAIKGSGVGLITLYPLLKDHRHYWGKKKPEDKDIRWYGPYAQMKEMKDGWYAVFTESSAKDFFLEKLIPYGVDTLSKL